MTLSGARPSSRGGAWICAQSAMTLSVEPAAGQPAIPAPADPLQHGRRHVFRVGRQLGCDLRTTGEPQARFLRQWRVDNDVVELVVAPVMGYRLAGPQPLENAEDLVGATAALAERHAGDLVFMRVPADPDAEFEAAAREVLQAGDLPATRPGCCKAAIRMPAVASAISLVQPATKLSVSSGDSKLRQEPRGQQMLG
jgi:hypothetical protein